MGSYTVILAIACYVYTSLAYITLDVLRRVLNNYFSRAYTNVPFQRNGESSRDFILLLRRNHCLFGSVVNNEWGQEGGMEGNTVQCEI